MVGNPVSIWEKSTQGVGEREKEQREHLEERFRNCVSDNDAKTAQIADLSSIILKLIVGVKRGESVTTILNGTCYESMLAATPGDTVVEGAASQGATNGGDLAANGGEMEREDGGGESEKSDPNDSDSGSSSDSSSSDDGYRTPLRAARDKSTSIVAKKQFTPQLSSTMRPGHFPGVGISDTTVLAPPTPVGHGVSGIEDKRQEKIKAEEAKKRRAKTPYLQRKWVAEKLGKDKRHCLWRKIGNVDEEKKERVWNTLTAQFNEKFSTALQVPDLKDVWGAIQDSVRKEKDHPLQKSMAYWTTYKKNKEPKDTKKKEKKMEGVKEEEEED